MIFSLLNQFESTIVVIVLDLAKKDQLLPVIFSGIEHNHRNIIQYLMKIVQNSMRTNERIALSYPDYEYDRFFRRPLLNILYDKVVISGQPERIPHSSYNTVKTFVFFKVETLFKIALFFQYLDSYVVEVKYNDLKTVR